MPADYHDLRLSGIQDHGWTHIHQFTLEGWPPIVLKAIQDQFNLPHNLAWLAGAVDRRHVNLAA